MVMAICFLLLVSLVFTTILEALQAYLAGTPLAAEAQVAREFGREANADMGFKAIWWLAALAGEHNKYDGKVHAYPRP